MNAISIGSRIREARKAAGLTQKQLAEKCGMFDSALRRIESGKHIPNLVTLEMIAEFLGVTVSQLISEEPQEQDKHPVKVSRLDLIAGLIWDLAQKCQSKQEFTEAIQGVISAMFWEV